MKRLYGPRLKRDMFHELIEDPRFQGPLEVVEKQLEYYRDYLKRIDAKDEESIDIKLALMHVRVNRWGTELRGKDLLRELKDMHVLARGHEVRKIKYRIILAEYFLLVKEDFHASKAILKPLEKRLKNSEHHLLYGMASKWLATLNTLMNNCQRAEEYFHDCISIFRRFNSPLQYAYCLNNYGVLKKRACAYAEAEQYLRKAQHIFEAKGALDGLFMCLANLGIVKMKLGEWNNAEFYVRRALQTALGLTENISKTRIFAAEINLGHLFIMKREFQTAQNILLKHFERYGDGCFVRRKALSLEFLGELNMETGRLGKAGEYFREAFSIAKRIAPESDLVTEILRRQANLHLLKGNLEKAEETARQCVSLSKRIGDKHELGAVLRILGLVLAKRGLDRKASSAFEASLNVLKNIHECYELMRTYLACGEFHLERNDKEADVYLLEAKQLAKRLDLKFYLSRATIALARRAINLGYFQEAQVYLQKAESLCESMDDPMEKEMHADIRRYQSMLEKAVLKESVQSAKQLKALGKIYEEARFPMEEGVQELALEVARQVGAQKLFLLRKGKNGYSIPIRYNITSGSARKIVKYLSKCKGGDIFSGNGPAMYGMDGEGSLLCVPGQGEIPYVLCSMIKGRESISKKELEFLIASEEAMEKVADEAMAEKTISSADTGGFSLTGGSTEHPAGSFRNIITKDPELIKLIKLAERVSKSDVPILLQGETGVGKELFARAIHESSPRGNKNFVAINTGGIPANFLESELFGYVKGAYTGAGSGKNGLVEEARGGTLFLDEVAEMSEELQVKLLRLLENGEYRRLGGNELRRADARIISATNKDIDLLVKRGKFRKDLYYRLSTVRFTIPALRFRKDDIELLVRHFLTWSLEKLGRFDHALDVDMKAMQAFELYDWPGNVREMQNEIMRIVSLMGEGRVIRFGMLSAAIKNYFRARSDSGFLEKSVERYERRLILRALEENDWNKGRTAEKIGVPRSTLLAKMRRLNIAS